MILQNLPPPPSSDTTNYAQRHVTLASPTSPFANGNGTPTSPSKDRKSTLQSEDLTASGASTPEQIRFKAFPYSGVNDYLLYCEAGYLSVGGGDGKYGLWLDNSLEKGVSSHCMTFGNECLSDEGEKFEVLGVEIWHVGA
jgi:TLD